jgi:hypothetical protein
MKEKFENISPFSLFSESKEIPIKLVDLSTWNPFQPALPLNLMPKNGTS